MTNNANITYSITIGERRGMINETDIILSAYDKNLSKKELGKLVCTKGLLPDLNWSSTIVLVTRFFSKRYMNPYYKYKPALFMQDLGWVSGRDQSLLYFVFTSLVEEPLYNFITEQLHLNHSGMDTVNKQDVMKFLERDISSKGLSFNEKTVDRVANGVFASLKDFGWLVEGEGLPHKTMKVERHYLTDKLLLALTYFLRKNKSNDFDVVHHKLWALFGLNGYDIIKRLIKMPEFYLVQTSGSLVQLSAVIKNEAELIQKINEKY